MPPSMTVVPVPLAKSTGGGPLGGPSDVNSASASASVLPLLIGKMIAWCSWVPGVLEAHLVYARLEPLEREAVLLALVVSCQRGGLSGQLGVRRRAGHGELTLRAELGVAGPVVGALVVADRVLAGRQHLGHDPRRAGLGGRNPAAVLDPAGDRRALLGDGSLELVDAVAAEQPDDLRRARDLVGVLQASSSRAPPSPSPGTHDVPSSCRRRWPRSRTPSAWRAVAFLSSSPQPGRDEHPTPIAATDAIDRA